MIPCHNRRKPVCSLPDCPDFVDAEASISFRHYFRRGYASLPACYEIPRFRERSLPQHVVLWIAERFAEAG
jgi:hypothetical protein